MKFDYSSLDAEQFCIRSAIVAGEACKLIFPNSIKVKWDKDNLIYRSVVVTEDGYPISLGFRRFANASENPELYKQPPDDLRGCELLSKEDGSLLVWSLYKHQLIVRTRGTIDASEQETGFEIQILKDRYPLIEAQLRGDANSEGTTGYSILTEWVGGAHKIVLSYSEGLDIYLIGWVEHSNYSYASQSFLDIVAKTLGLKRPEVYKFDTLPQALETVRALKGKEGICIYHGRGQEITKVKSDWYKHLHRMKSEISNLEKVIDVFIAQGYPTYTDFYKFIEMTLDYELAEQAKGHMSKTCDVYKRVKPIIEGFEKFVEKIKNLPTRKEQALAIVGAYSTTNRAAMVFKLLDGKPLAPDDIKKLIYQAIHS